MKSIQSKGFHKFWNSFNQCLYSSNNGSSSSFKLMKISSFSCTISIFGQYFNNKIQIFGSNETHGNTSENIESQPEYSWSNFESNRYVQKFPQSMTKDWYKGLFVVNKK